MKAVKRRPEGCPYKRADDSIKHSFDEPPTVVDYFFHEEAVPWAKKKR